MSQPRSGDVPDLSDVPAPEQSNPFDVAPTELPEDGFGADPTADADEVSAARPGADPAAGPADGV